MTSLSKLSVDEKITTIETRFNNTLKNSEISNLISRFNINQAYLEGGLQLSHEARSASNKQKKEYSEQYNATNQRDLKLDNVIESYNESVSIASLVTSTANIKSALPLTIHLPDAIGAKMEQIRTFYEVILNEPQIMELMSRFNKSQAVLEQEKAELDELYTLQQKQVMETGEAQQATQLRNQAVEKMLARDKELVTILKLALGKRNDLLESVGLFNRS